ncbi:hypothetical protein KDL29_05660 [bacterium]|nr:hypothetical protein [bacterium]
MAKWGLKHRLALAAAVFVLLGLAGLQAFAWRLVRNPPGTVYSLRMACGSWPYQQIPQDGQGRILLPQQQNLTLVDEDLGASVTLAGVFYSMDNQPFNLSPTGTAYGYERDDGICRYDSTGRQVWSFNPADVYWVRSMEALDHGAVMVDTSSRLLRLDGSGNLLWWYKAGEYHPSKCGFHEEYLRMAIGPDDVVAYDTSGVLEVDVAVVDADGQQRWVLNDDDAYYQLISQGRVGNSLFISWHDHRTDDNRMYCYDWKGGQIASHPIEIRDDDPVASSPGTFSVANRENLYVFDESGQLKWQSAGEGYVSAALHLPDGRYLAVRDSQSHRPEIQLFNADGQPGRSTLLPTSITMVPLLHDNGLVYLALRDRIVAIDPARL